MRVFYYVKWLPWPFVQGREMCRSRWRLWLLYVGMACLSVSVRSLQAQPLVPEGEVDLFVGVDLRYRDIYHDKVYQWLINLTPGVKWHIGKQWQMAAQVLIPVVNDYGERYKKVRVNLATLSKELYMGQLGFLKLSGGWFTQERYGLDAKGFWIVNSWLCLEAQAGLTGYLSMSGPEWEASKPQRLTGLVGADVYLTSWNTQFRVRGGRFLYEDNGVVGDVMRHFKHSSVGLYGEYSDKGGWNGGFKVVVMIPPYRRARHRVNFRPASNFRHVYNYGSNSYQNMMYQTDPEENEREGWFDRERLPWGSNTMVPDFQTKGGAR